MTRLQVGLHQTTLFVDAVAPVVLAIGTARLVAEHLRHEPPTGGELESAIEAIEDVLMPVIPRLRGSGAVTTSDAESVALAIASGTPEGAVAGLDIDEVERVFDRLANVAAGRPAESEGIPARAAFAANLLIVRELMHHAGRTRLTVYPWPDDPHI